MALCVAQPSATRAQDWSGNAEGSTTDGPTVEQYMKDAGPNLKFFAYGSLKIDGNSVNRGERPTATNPNFDSWGGAFPGFLILNSKKIEGLSNFEVSSIIIATNAAINCRAPTRPRPISSL